MHGHSSSEWVGDSGPGRTVSGKSGSAPPPEPTHAAPPRRGLPLPSMLHGGGQEGVSKPLQVDPTSLCRAQCFPQKNLGTFGGIVVVSGPS